MDRIGRYQIVKELGRGAMGAVYKALDPQIDRTVAIKIILTANLSAKDLENYKQRFYREARAAGKMSHGSIVTIYDITEDAATGQPYLVMEFVEGRTLDQVMDEHAARGEKMLTAQALDVARQIAEALDYAHRRGVVHRDVKPANILITEEGVAKIADFGIAKMEGVQLTQTGNVLGTPAFMAPEQFSGGEVDARSDLFSLGSILYWMLSGEKPFHAETLSMVTYKVVFAEPPPVAQVNPALPQGANFVLARCLAKKPPSRYASCKELADDLDALMTGKPVRATALPHEEATVVTPPPSPAAAPADASRELQRTVATSPAAPEKTQAIPIAPERTQAAPLASHVASQVNSPVASSPRPPVGVPAPAAAASASGKRPLRWKRAAILVGLLMAFLTAAGVFVQRQAEQQRPQQRPEASAPAPAEVERPRVEPPPEPARDPAPVETRDPDPPRASKGSSKSRRNRGGFFSGPKATLRVECLHNFRDGTLEISTGGEVILRAALRGRETDLGVTKIYNGVYRGSVELPAGEHVFNVRAYSRRSNYDEADDIGGAFAEDGSRTLVIEFGRGSGIAVFNRKLTLRWK